MALELRQLCESDNYRYGLHLVAGEKGLSRIVQWVHTLEDAEVCGFLHGGELIFTTGIGNRNQSNLDWMLPLVKNLHEKESSGVVINIGPYISHVPNEVIAYCNENDYPIFTLPWEVHVVDVTRDFCTQIIEEDKAESDVGHLLQNIIFYPNDADKYMPSLQNHGFMPKMTCCLIGAQFQEDFRNNKKNIRFAQQLLQRKMKKYTSYLGVFQIQFNMYFVLGACTEKKMEMMKDELRKIVQNGEIKGLERLAMGPEDDLLEHLSRSYSQVNMMLSTMDEEQHICFYNDLGVKKMILAINDEDFLWAYQKRVLGKLEEYDEGNGTNLLDIYRTYIECDGSVQKVAESTFTHRNTINYQLRKIRNILGLDMDTLDNKIEVILALYINDMMKGKERRQ